MVLKLSGLPRYVDVVRVEAPWDELDTGVLLYVVHSLRYGQPVILTEVVRESVGNLKGIMIKSEERRRGSQGRISLHCLSAKERSCTDRLFSSAEID